MKKKVGTGRTLSIKRIPRMDASRKGRYAHYTMIIFKGGTASNPLNGSILQTVSTTGEGGTSELIHGADN